jgi:predicted nucleic acid-binding protein
MEGRTVRIVLDANLVMAFFFPLPYSKPASEQLKVWRRDEAELLAPTLLQYEVNNALHRILAAGVMPPPKARTALQEMQAMGIRFVPPTNELHARAWYWTDRLNQAKTYDAQYVALAELKRANFWTADRRLASGARQVGVEWVRWIGESEPDRL